MLNSLSIFIIRLFFAHSTHMFIVSKNQCLQNRGAALLSWYRFFFTFICNSFCSLDLSIAHRRAMGMQVTQFIMILWMLNITSHLGMEDCQLSKSKTHHSTNRYLIFSMMLYCECTMEPYNEQFQRNARMVFCLSIHCLSLWYQVYLGLWQFRSQ